MLLDKYETIRALHKTIVTHKQESKHDYEQML
jgi:hypothetical protein